MSLKSSLESALLELEDNYYVGQDSVAIKSLRSLIGMLDNYQLVPKEPTAEMLKAAFQDGIIVNGRPIWKHDTDFQNKWKYQQMLENEPEIKL